MDISEIDLSLHRRVKPSMVERITKTVIIDKDVKSVWAVMAITVRAQNNV